MVGYTASTGSIGCNTFMYIRICTCMEKQDIFLNLVMLAGNHSLEAAVHLVSCRGSSRAQDGPAAALPWLRQTSKHKLNCWPSTHSAITTKTASRCSPSCIQLLQHKCCKLSLPSVERIIYHDDICTWCYFWLLLYISQNKQFIQTVFSVCVSQEMSTYNTGLVIDSLKATLGFPITQGQLYSLSILWNDKPKTGPVYIIGNVLTCSQSEWDLV